MGELWLSSYSIFGAKSVSSICSEHVSSEFIICIVRSQLSQEAKENNLNMMQIYLEWNIYYEHVFYFDIKPYKIWDSFTKQ